MVYSRSPQRRDIGQRRRCLATRGGNKCKNGARRTLPPPRPLLIAVHCTATSDGCEGDGRCARFPLSPLGRITPLCDASRERRRDNRQPRYPLRRSPLQRKCIIESCPEPVAGAMRECTIGLRRSLYFSRQSPLHYQNYQYRFGGGADRYWSF